MKKSFISTPLLILLLSAQFTLARDLTDEQEKIISEYSFLDPWVSKDKFEQIAKDVIADKTFAQQVIVVDTRDQQNCHNVYRHLLSKGWPAKKSMCDFDQNNPFVSINLGTEILKSELTPEQKKFANAPDFFSGDSVRRQELYERTGNIALLSGGVVAAFASQSAESSGWDMQGLKENGVFGQINTHWNNGPVRDKDGLFVNFVLHPITGTLYYQAARISGYSKLQSFGYSVLMSTLFWEYGVESIFETPSWNDLWATPVIGSLLGEVFLQLYLKIEKNNGEVLGSKSLGFGAKLILNSAETVRPYINKILGSKFLKSGRAGIVVTKCSQVTNSAVDQEDLCPFFTIEYRF